jgi:hypothetical protein
MSSTFNKINEVFNASFDKQTIPESTSVAEVVKEKKENAVVVKTEYQAVVAKSKEEIRNNFADDYEFIRDTLRDLITTGRNSLDVAKELAEETESPRAFEVCTTIINTIAGLGKELTNLHKEAIKINDNGTNQPKQQEENVTSVTNIQNNIYTDPNAVYQVLDDIQTREFDDSDLE